MVAVNFSLSFENLGFVVKACFLALPAYFLIRQLLVWLNNKLYSDLHSVPGPTVSEWTRARIGWSQAYHIICMDPFETVRLFTRWRKKYGPVYKIRSTLGEVVIMATSASAIRTVNISKSDNFEKMAMAKKFIGPLVGDEGIMLAEGKTHARIRKRVAPAMHHEALVGLSGVFLQQAKLFAERLGTCDPEKLDVVAETRLATFSVIYTTCFGTDIAQPERIARLQKAYHEVFEEPLWKTFISSLLALIFWFVDPSVFNWREDLHRYIKNTSKLLCEEYFHRESQNEKPSQKEKPLLSLMVDADTNMKISSGEMVDTVLSFLVAGQITTSASISWTLSLLGREPQWQERLLQELQTWREEDGLERLDALPLLDCVVKESIRLYPPLCNVTRITTKPTNIDGYQIPAGIAVRMPITSMQRDEEIWGNDADKFNPDRFLDEDLVVKSKMFWSAFMFGSRGCIGQRFALLEIKALVSMVILQHVIVVRNPEIPQPSCRGCFAVPKDMKIYFERR